jgi:eukaryotic-like serine/threonine-protein kinase
MKTTSTGAPAAKTSCAVFSCVMARNRVVGDGGWPGDKPLDFLSNQPIKGEATPLEIAYGSIRLHEALKCAIEIGSILTAAHSAGRFHGSLSPASIVVTHGGARLIEPSDTSGAQAAEFVAPERLRGEVPDSGSDVFAFGALLRWLIARTDAGEGAESIERLIAALTAPDPLHRCRQIRHAVLELRVARSMFRCAAQSRNHPAPRARKSPNSAGAYFSTNEPWRRLVWIAGIALFLVAASAIGAVLFLDREPVSRAVKFTIVPPEHTEYLSGPAVSPDGARVVLSAIALDGRRMLWLRSLDALHTLAIPGTEDGSAPFWSPDSSSIGFFASGSMKKVGIAGGPPETICSAESVTGGGTWSGGTILFAPGSAAGLYRVSAAGGNPQRVVSPDPAKGEQAYQWPKFLVDGQHFVFFDRTDSAATTGVYVGSLSEADNRMLFASGSNAVFAPSASGESRGRGYLLFSKGGSLMSLAFNDSRLQIEGDPVTLADDIGAFASLSLTPVSVSNNGVLAYQGAGRQTRQLAWVDRAGRLLSFVGGPADYTSPWISSDGRQITVEKLGPGGKLAETLILDAEGKAPPVIGVPSSFLFNETSEGVGAVSPDGKWLAYESQDSGSAEVYVQPNGIPSNSKSRRRVSAGGGYSPRWRRDQAEIYYLAASGDLMSVTVRRAESGPEFDGARALFRTRLLSKTRNSFDVSPDGQTFLMNLPLEDATSSPITVVTNWTGKLK